MKFLQIVNKLFFDQKMEKLGKNTQLNYYFPQNPGNAILQIVVFGIIRYLFSLY